MTTAIPARVGILAGGGTLPREVAESVVARGGHVEVVAIEGEITESFDRFPHTFVRWGEVGRISGALRRAGCTHLVIVGSARRPDLGRLKLDLGFFLALPAVLRSIASGGDDALLRGVVRHFEAQGFRVAGPAEIAPELLIGEGVLGQVLPSPDNATDIALGFEVVARLGPFDVGQGVAVAKGRVLAIEGAEGTDAMLARVGERRARATNGDARIHGVFVKRPKPGQELRVDLPTIGPETVSRTAAAGLAGIAVEAGRTLAAARRDLVAGADAVGIFVSGVKSREGDATEARATARSGIDCWRHRGRVPVPKRDHENIGRGAGIARVLRTWNVGRCVVVVRRHVLAVEAGEGVVFTIARAGGLRQWGRSRKRAGVAVVASGRDIRDDVVEAARSAGLAGLAFLDEEPSSPVVDAMDRAGLFVATAERERPER